MKKDYYELPEYVNDSERCANSERHRRLTALSQFIDFKALQNTLEVGCGSGVHKYDFTGWVGVDISKAALKRAKPANLILASAEALPITNSTFQLVISFNVIEHIYNPKAFLDENLRVCKNDGYIVISSPELMEKNLMFRLIYDTLREIKRLLKRKTSLNPRFRIPDYTKIGHDADAIYLTDLADIMRYLKSQRCVIVNEMQRKYLFWLKSCAFLIVIAKKLR